MTRNCKEAGVTLFELMIALAVAAILLTLAVPSFKGLSDKNQLKGAAQRLASELQYAHGEAISRSNDVTLDFNSTSDTDWCIGVVDNAATCDCSATTPDCLVDSQTHVVDGADYRGVSVTAPTPPTQTDVTFGGARGLPANGASVQFDLQSDDGKKVAVQLNPIGSVRLCSPAGSGNLWEYPEC